MSTNKFVRGRELFKKYYFLIKILIFILKLFFPKKFLLALWSLTDNFKGNIFLVYRYAVVKIIAKSCGINIYIGPNVELRHLDRMELGSNISIHRFCYFDAAGGLKIEDDVSIAHNTSILTTNHVWENPELAIKDQEVRYDKVTIEQDVWIGCGCRILSGVTVHSRSVVAAGSVVTKDVPSNVVVGGVPAKILKEI